MNKNSAPVQAGPPEVITIDDDDEVEPVQQPSTATTHEVEGPLDPAPSSSSVSESGDALRRSSRRRR